MAVPLSLRTGTNNIFTAESNKSLSALHKPAKHSDGNEYSIRKTEIICSLIAKVFPYIARCLGIYVIFYFGDHIVGNIAGKTTFFDANANVVLPFLGAVSKHSASGFGVLGTAILTQWWHIRKSGVNHKDEVNRLYKRIGKLESVIDSKRSSTIRAKTRKGDS